MMQDLDDELIEIASVVLRNLRAGKGIDTLSVNLLKQKLGLAAETWKKRTEISKKAANLFVDLSSGIASCSYSYGGKEAEEILLLSDEIGTLVRSCVQFD